jgi:hypothetical protein
VALAQITTKRWFFDRDLVTSRMSRTTRVTFIRIGGNVRTIARRSMRKRKAPSPVGEPPSSHEGSLRNRLFFLWDPQTESVVIGPERFNHIYFGGDRKPIRGAVPGILEDGGQIQRLETQWPNGTWSRADFRSPRRWQGRPRRFVTITIGARPYMRPALDKSKGRYAHIWADAWSSGRVTE